MASEWKEMTLGDLGPVITGRTPPGKLTGAFGSDVPFVTPRDMDGRRIINKTERYLSHIGVKAVKRAVIPPGSIMVSCIGSDMGKVAIAGSRCVTNQQINSIVVTEEHEALYVYYSLSQRKLELRGLASGSAQPILNKSHFSHVKIELPPLPEQRAIAHILGTLDDKIELNRRMNETLEAMARALFKSWFVDFDPVWENIKRKEGNARAQGRKGAEESAHPDNAPALPDHILALFPDSFQDSELGPIPRGWRVTSLGDGIEIFDSKRIPLNKRQRMKRKGPYPYYGAAGVMDYIDDYLFNGIYVLTGEDGSVIDKAGYPIIQYVWGQFWVNNHAHVLQGKNGITTEHLYLLLQNTNIAAYVTGAVQPKLNQKNLKSIPMILPNLSICCAFSDIIQPSFAKLRANTEESRALAALRDTLLPKLISGELRVPDVERFLTEAGV